MADSAIVTGGKYKKIAQAAIVTGGKYKNVSEIAVVTGGKYKKGWEAYVPPTFPDVSVNSIYLNDEILRLAGTAISLSDLAVPLSHGYTRFKCTISGEVDALDRGMLYVGISANGNDVYGGPAYDYCGSYHNGTGSSSTTVTFNVDLDIASLISTYGSSGTIQFGYRANDYVGYTPDIIINASMTNIRVTKA